jgi:hypothetical protein
MNIYGDAATADMRTAHEKVAKLILPQASQASVIVKSDCETLNH